VAPPEILRAAPYIIDDIQRITDEFDFSKIQASRDALRHFVSLK